MYAFLDAACHRLVLRNAEAHEDVSVGAALGAARDNVSEWISLAPIRDRV